MPSEPSEKLWLMQTELPIAESIVSASARAIGASARNRSRSVKSQASPMMRPPPTAGSYVQRSAGIAPRIHRHHERLRPDHTRQQRLDLLHLRRESAIEADH
ncbi:hypothetical protein [Thiocapsa marina]|uniref:hypothetical protein n=1 Tax=Thiocapsa marina TaxID=244573 RepID=UPI000592932B|nr:hypothetical protein [Thiocapsa marina]